MKIFIDADGCPVVKIALEIAKLFSLKTIIVADTSHNFDNYNANQIITVSKGSDSADFRIVNMINENDIVITQDYGLAAMCLAKKANVINQNGLIYTEDNIDMLLGQRHIGKKIRNSGGRMKGPSKRTRQQDINFETNLKQVIKNALEK